MVKLLTEFTEGMEMETGSGSGLYRALLFGMELSSIEMGGIFKAILPQSTGNQLLKQS